jgi:ribonuclease P protein component
VRRDQRLRNSRDFSAVHRRGKSYANDLLVLRCLRTDGSETRFGFAVGKKLGGAVVRNRVKRRLRAATANATFAPGWDVVVIARPLAASRDFAALSSGLFALLKKARLLVADAGEGGGRRTPSASESPRNPP